MKILFAESDFWKGHQDLKKKYEKSITNAYVEVGKLFQVLPKDLTFLVQVSVWECIPETGEGGYTKNSRLIILSLDPGLPYGEEYLLKTLKSTVFHELNHAVRYESSLWHKDFTDSCIMEGLATVFERDYGKSKPLYGHYKVAESKKWLKEITAFKDNYNWGDYMFKHPDGRRWIGYKVGTFIIDESIKNSGKSILDLTLLECVEIRNLAKI